MPTAKIGLWVFLAVVGCAVRAVHQRLRDAHGTCATGSALAGAAGCCGSTPACCCVGSVALQCALIAARGGQTELVRLAWLAGGADALAFLVGQLVGLAASSRRRLLPGRQPGRQLLLPAHRHARPAPARRAGGARPATSRGLGAGADAGELRLQRRAVRHATGTSCCCVWLVLFAAARLGDAERCIGICRTIADLKDASGWPRRHAACTPAPRPPGLRGMRRRLVVRPARLQERVLGQGDDVDLPAQRHLHLRLLPDRPT